MNKKTLKIISFLAILISVVVIGTNCFAAKADLDATTIGEGTTVETGLIGSVGGNLAAVIRNIGIVISVLILMVLGIKYMMGSAEEKAEYKKTMIPYVVGAIVLFGASALAGAIIQLAQGITA